MNRQFGKAYLATLVPFIVLDALWLGLVAQTFYQSQIGFIMAKNPIWAAAIVFYLLYVAGMVVFTVQPSLNAGGLGRAAARGAFFGLVAYATYDLTNLATLQGWPITVTIVDLIWGASVSALSTVAAVWFLSRRGK